MLPYEHPYRRFVVAAFRHQRELRTATAIAGVLWLAYAIAAVAGAGELAFGAAVGALIAIAFWLVAIVMRVSRRQTQCAGPMYRYAPRLPRWV